MTEKRKLPVLGKSLMPEVLPDPLRAKDGAGSSARSRVRSRLEQIKTNAAAMAAASAIVACDSGGYSVVDPLPTPAGRGAGGNGPHWPTAGYGVVDPLPPPAGSGGYGGPPTFPMPTAGVGAPPVTVIVQCSMEQALDAKSAKAIWLSKDRVLFMIAPAPGIPPTAVKLTQIISNALGATDISAGQVPFSIQLDSKPWPDHTYIKVTAMCGTPTIVNSTLTFDIDTSVPKDSGDVPIALRVPDEADAGAP